MRENYKDTSKKKLRRPDDYKILFLSIDEPVPELINGFGTEFVSYISNYGYDRVLRILYVFILIKFLFLVTE